tara:strand:+ start:968 stop:1747 length:780 start_codon:yes stop_codon:yes gene_type:complete
MGYLDIYNNDLSGNTCRVYVSDYGKSLLTAQGGFFHAIEKFTLSDLDIDYRKFVGNGSCTGQTTYSALTGSCFYDLPDLRGGDPISLSADMGTTAAVMEGTRCEVENGIKYLYNTSLGVSPVLSSLHVRYTPTEHEDEIKEDISGSINQCWKNGSTVSNLFPSYCTTCADFNLDGRVDYEDFKTFLQYMGSSSDGDDVLVGDFNGDGKVDMFDFYIFSNCLRYNGFNGNEYCTDKEIFCLLCDKLGPNSPCNGDCLTCI